MNGKTAKRLRRWAAKAGIPAKVAYRAWKALSHKQRKQVKLK